jgi:hypothetical protein
MVAAAVIGGAALSAGASMIGSSTAAGAAKDAANVSKEQQAQTRADLLPYNQAGQSVLPSLQALAMSGPTGGGPDYVTQAAGERPGQMTQAQLEQTPGYQWNLAQGLKATQSAAAARGLGVSGASLKGAATYATGLADSTYMNQFNIAQQRFTDLLNLNTGQQGNLNNQYSRLSGVATLGANAAAQTGQQGTTAAGNQGNYLNQSGLASAAGASGVGNAVTGGINSYLGYNALQSYLNPGGTGGYGIAPGGSNTF